MDFLGSGAEAVLTWLMVPVFEACNHWSNQTVPWSSCGAECGGSWNAQGNTQEIHKKHVFFPEKCREYIRNVMFQKNAIC